MSNINEKTATFVVQKLTTKERTSKQRIRGVYSFHLLLDNNLEVQFANNVTVASSGSETDESYFPEHTEIASETFTMKDAPTDQIIEAYLLKSIDIIGSVSGRIGLSVTPVHLEGDDLVYEDDESTTVIIDVVVGDGSTYFNIKYGDIRYRGDNLDLDSLLARVYGMIESY